MTSHSFNDAADSFSLPKNPRLHALYRYNILNTPSEGLFRNVVDLVVQTFNCKLGLLSFVDEEEVFYKEVVARGEDVPDFTGACVPLSQSPCAFAVYNPYITVLDKYPTKEDPLWSAYNFQVTQFGLKFYAGAPLVTSDGYAIGMLGIVDSEPRLFTDFDRSLLASITKIIIDELELRTNVFVEIEKQKKLIHQLHDNNEKLALSTNLVREKNQVITNLNSELKEANQLLEIANRKLIGQVTEKSKKLVKSLKSLISSQRDLETLTYHASHGLRSPISTLQGLVNLAKHDIREEPAINYFNKVASISRLMQRTVSKIEMMYNLTNRNTIKEGRELSAKDFTRIIEESLRIFKSEIDERGIQVEVFVQNNISCIGVDIYYKLIMENIIENAILFSKPKSMLDNDTARLVIKVEKIDATSFYILFYDNGEGISDQLQAKIFDMFFRGSDKGGTGLGLFIVKKAVDIIGGKIAVESEQGNYSQFTIFLPVHHL